MVLQSSTDGEMTAVIVNTENRRMEPSLSFLMLKKTLKQLLYNLQLSGLIITQMTDYESQLGVRPVHCCIALEETLPMRAVKGFPKHS